MYEKPKEWTNKETELLILNYSPMSSAELVKLLNRPKNSIIGKAFRLGLTKSNVSNRKPSIKKIKPISEKETVPKKSLKYEDLKPNQCQFPYGSDNKTFCGKEKSRGAYCEEHYKKCYKSVKSH